jgi:hypothetical protein
MVHALFTLDNWGYTCMHTHSFRICNICWFSTAALVTRMRHIVTVHTLPVLLIHLLDTVHGHINCLFTNLMLSCDTAFRSISTGSPWALCNKLLSSANWIFTHCSSEPKCICDKSDERKGDTCLSLTVLHEVFMCLSYMTGESVRFAEGQKILATPLILDHKTFGCVFIIIPHMGHFLFDIQLNHCFSRQAGR